MCCGFSALQRSREGCLLLNAPLLLSASPRRGNGDTIDSRTFGPVPESMIIGRVCIVAYSYDDTQPVLSGYRRERTFLVPQ